MFSSRCIYILVLLTLTACGGGESAAPKEPIKLPPATTISDPTLDLTGQAGTSLAVVKKINGVQSVNNAAVSSSFANALGINNRQPTIQDQVLLYARTIVLLIFKQQ